MMREARPYQIAIGAVVASSLGYLINQLPAIPDFPYKTECIVGAVILLTLITIALAVWQMHQEAQKPSGIRRSTIGAPVNNKQFKEIPAQNRPQLNLSHTPYTQRPALPWKSLFVLGMLHFFPALALSSALYPLGGWAVAGVLAGVGVAAWAWTLALIWACTTVTGIWLVVTIILLLSGAGGWALFLLMLVGLTWVLYVFLATITSIFGIEQDSWSWPWALVLIGVASLILAKAWGWIGGLILALALAGAFNSTKEKLGRFSLAHTFFILSVDSGVWMGIGGLLGWTIRVAGS